MYHPLVSIITPVYNVEQYPSEVIESALAQTYHNFELLIVNDGSTDNSADIIRPFLKDSGVIYIEQKNAGVAATLEQDESVTLVYSIQDFIDTYSNKIDYYWIIGGAGCASCYCFVALFKSNFISILTVLIWTVKIDEVGLFNE